MLTRSSLTRYLLVILVAIATWGSNAQPVDGPLTTLSIGQQPLRIPAPAGFVETSHSSPDLYATALLFGAGDARIVAHFVTDKDRAGYESGNTVVLENFLLVQTPKRAENIVATQAQFDKLRAGTVALQTDLGRRLAPRLAKELERISKDIWSNQAAEIKFRVGDIVPVSVDRDDARVLIYTVLAQIGIAENNVNRSQTMVYSTAYCLVAGKVLMLAAYRHFRTPEDLEASRMQITMWANSVLSAN